MKLFLLHLQNINSETRSWFKVILKWTGWLCHSSLCNLVALVFTGCYCALSGDMSPHWKWSASILSAHFSLIRCFVSLGNWRQLQPHCLWKIKLATHPLLCEKFLMNKILSGKTFPNTLWVDSPWLKVRPHRPKYFLLTGMLEGFVLLPAWIHISRTLTLCHTQGKLILLPHLHSDAG